MDTGYYFLILIISAGLAFIPASIAKDKGYSFWGWWFYGWMLWIVAIIHVALIRDKNAPTKSVIQQSSMPYYYENSAGTSAADELIKYKELLDKGVITQEEFETQKNKLIAPSADKAQLPPLLKRAFMFLEDGKWQEADAYFESVLNYDPENAQAYLGKLMAELKVKTQNELSTCEKSFEGSDNYKKAIRFGDEEMISTLKGYISQIEIRNENNRLGKIYDDAVSLMNLANKMERFTLAANKFAEIPGFKDADTLAQQCLDKAEALRLESERKSEERRAAVEKIKTKTKRIFSIAAPIILVAILIILLTVKIIIPAVKYNRAQKLLDSGNYSEAAVIFEKLSYKDSEEKTQESKYLEAVELHNAGEYEEAFFIFNNLSYKDSAEKAKDSAEKAFESLFLYQKQNLHDLKAGSTIKFGAYEQDNDLQNGKEEIEWDVLEVKGNKALIISKYALDSQPFDDSAEKNTTWDKCSLRTWLNETFINEAFGSEHQNLILETTVKAHANPYYSDLDAGNNTDDKVFLLSVKEAEKYFNSDSDRVCKLTKYAKSGYSASWWLRSPGREGYSKVCYIDSKGSFEYAHVDFPRDVRPAMWINFGSSSDKTALIAESKKTPEQIFQEQKQALENVKTGDVIEFGSYQQDANPAVGKEPIEWRVLAVEDDKALIMSKYALDYQQYNATEEDITWENCSLRKWLNESFINGAFSTEHQELILETDVEADANPSEDAKTNPGNNTKDRVFILSCTEFEKNFDLENSLEFLPTGYTKKLGLEKKFIRFIGKSCYRYWLRTPGFNHQFDAMCFVYDGAPEYFTCNVEDKLGVYPALWIKLDS